MNNKLIGSLITLITLFGCMFLLTPDLLIFFSVPTLLFILGIGGGLTILKKDNYPKDKLFQLFKENCIAAAWMGSIVGFIIMLPSIPYLWSAEMSITSPDNLGSGISFIFLSNFYGYLFGPLVQAFFEN